MPGRRLAVVLLALTASTGCKLLERAPPAPPPTRNVQPGQPGYVEPGARLGPLHERYAGKVVFSSQPIALDGSDDSSVYTTYELGQPLYMRYWSATSPHNLMTDCTRPRVVLRGEVDDELGAGGVTNLTAFGLYDLSPDDLMTYDAGSLSNDVALAFTTAIPYDPQAREEAGKRAVRQFNAAVMTRLTDGRHRLRVVVNLDCGAAAADDPIVAEGTLTVEVPPGGLTEYLRRFGTELAPSPHPENTALVPDMLAAMQRRDDWDNEELIGVAVMSPAWIPVRDEETSVLVAKEVEAALVVHARKESRPEVCRLFDVTFARDVAGGPLTFLGNGSPEPFPCVNAPR